MKNSILILASLMLITSSILTSCNTSAEKVENAEKNVDKANFDLYEANQEYLADIEKYRKESADIIAANNKSIADFKARIALEKKEAQVAYSQKITVLERKNSDLKKKMDVFKAESKEQWEKFKVEFSKDMDELGTAFGNFFSL
tara:strand:+ start:1405 stop:1836 length:432 start_codon:yes stop_codon:yes gene_type:complete